jgi:secreted PhoX family phosphatase
MPLHRFSPARRTLLKRSGAIASTTFIGTLGALHARSAAAAGGKQSVPALSPYGPVTPVNDLTTGLPLLQLPAGFTYKSFGWTGDTMADGHPTPGNHDGMAVVESRRAGRSTELVLVRNHERAFTATPSETIQAGDRYSTGLVNGIITLGGALTVRIGANNAVVTNPLAPNPPPIVGYAGGGTTNLVFRDGNWVSATSSLGGTLGNCAGGPTPWGSWLSCEETLFDFSAIGGKKHGYVFEVDANPADSSAEPIVAMGRFPHEAVAVDPASGYIYQTEDNRNLAALYRFIPADLDGGTGSLHAGGTLQAARIRSIVNKASAATLAQANDQGLLNPEIGDEYELEWVDITDPDSDPRVVVGQPGGVSLSAMAGPTFEAMSKGCARMSRGEGIWHSAGRMYLVDTGAGVDSRARVGQGEGAVWELNLGTMRLRALFVSANQAVGNNPDNIVVSPRGGILLCEDGGFGDAGIRMLGLNPAGEAYTFCRNNVTLSGAQIAGVGKSVPAGEYRGSEFAGACFDPTGRVLFLNVYSPGFTVAISGPWARGNL